MIFQLNDTLPKWHVLSICVDHTSSSVFLFLFLWNHWVNLNQRETETFFNFFTFNIVIYAPVAVEHNKSTKLARNLISNSVEMKDMIYILFYVIYFWWISKKKKKKDLKISSGNTWLNWIKLDGDRPYAVPFGVRFKRCYQKSLIEEGQIIQVTKEKEQKDKHWSTQHYTEELNIEQHETHYKTDGQSRCSGRVNGSCSITYCFYIN